MKRDPDECLSAQTIVSYAKGDLSDDEKAAVERHVDECRLCAGAVEGVAGLESKDDYLNSADTVLTRLRLRAASGGSAADRSRARVWSARPFLALAAAVVIVAGLTAYLTRLPDADALFNEQFEPYPSTQPVVRGGADGVSHALSLYESRDYRGALQAFEGTLKDRPNDPTARFYAGLCQLALGRSADAIVNLEESRRPAAAEFEAPAEWYLALAYLRRHDIPEARSRLQKIAADDGFYADRARALLPALDRL